jgi:hypothetical protein
MRVKIEITSLMLALGCKLYPQLQKQHKKIFLIAMRERERKSV